MDNAVEFRNKKSFTKSENDEKMNETKIISLKELTIGDHLVLIACKNPTKYLHSILTNIEYELCLIEIIFYENGTEVIKDFVEENFTERNIGIKKTKIFANFQELDIFRLEYDPFKCVTVKETIQNAEKFLGQIKYNIFVNNDEHFCIFSKTGKLGKLFVLRPDLTKEVVLGKTFNNLSSACITNLATQGGQIMLVNTAKHVATSFPRSAVGTVLPEVTSAACSGIG